LYRFARAEKAQPYAFRAAAGIVGNELPILWITDFENYSGYGSGTIVPKDIAGRKD
jgi:hypothetical protein